MAPPPLAFEAGIFASDFRPAWWLRNAHAQTLFSTFFRKPPRLERQRETLALPDGDFLDLDWLLPEGWVPSQPLVLVVHGLSGSSESHYVLGLQHALSQQGWGSVALNCRGASGRPNDLPRAYHAGSSDDLRQVLLHMQHRYPQAPLALVGYSLGGSMTLKLLGESEAGLRLFAGVAVSVPLLLSVCADRLDRGFSRVYRQHFMKTLLANWEQKRLHLERRGSVEAAERIRAHLARAPFNSFWRFDDELIAPLHGFRDVHDYYGRSSARQYLRHIDVPTLLIQADDDPFMTLDILPRHDELSRYIRLERCQRGGHVGFIEGGSPAAPRYYLERKIPDFLRRCWSA